MYLKKKNHTIRWLFTIAIGFTERVKEMEKAMPIIEDLISKFEFKISESMDNDLVVNTKIIIN